jgi:hypothetical protein
MLYVHTVMSYYFNHQNLSFFVEEMAMSKGSDTAIVPVFDPLAASAEIPPSWFSSL